MAKKIKEEFFVYQALDLETSLSERKRIRKILDGESWDSEKTIIVDNKELLEVIIKPKNRKEPQME